MFWRLALPLSLALELELDLGLEFGSGLVTPLPGSWVLRLPARGVARAAVRSLEPESAAAGQLFSRSWCGSWSAADAVSSA